MGEGGHVQLLSGGKRDISSLPICSFSRKSNMEKYPQLDSLISKLEELDTWDGDLPGLQEDTAHAVQEAIEQIKKLKEVLTELEISY